LTESETDKQLVEAVLDGKTEAFNLLVWRWERPLYNFLLRFTGDADRAQDISQEAFLRSYLRLKELRERERYKSWLFRIAVNLYRSDRRRPALPVDDSVEMGDLETTAGRSGMAARELHLTVRALLTKLDPDHRAVVLLKVYLGFHFDEMAQILECPVSTVKSRLYKAFEELREGLQSERPNAAAKSLRF
jgi:RNA polymerase sigma-70 factor (ECF subfamily)